MKYREMREDIISKEKIREGQNIEKLWEAQWSAKKQWNNAKKDRRQEMAE